MTLDAAISLARGQRGNLQLLNDDKGALAIVAHRGFKEPFLEFFREVLHGELGASCGASMARGEVVVVDDVSASDVFRSRPLVCTIHRVSQLRACTRGLINHARRS